MGDKKLDYQISERYSYELNEIRNKMNQLCRGRIYELSNATMDGYLSTNVEQLRKMMNELLYKIQNDEDGTDEKISEAINSLHY